MPKKTPLVRAAIARPVKPEPLRSVVEAFVEGGEKEISKAAEPEAAPRQPEPTKRLTFDIPEDLHFRLKMHAMVQRTTIKDVIVDFLNERFPLPPK